MLYKEDWAEARAMFEAWWKRSRTDRPNVGFTAPRKEPVATIPPPAEPNEPRDYFLNMDYLLPKQERGMAEKRFFGTAFPHYSVNIGPGSLATYLGSEPGFSETTVWYEPCLDPENPESAALPEFDPENPWWKTHYAMVRAAAERAKGKCLVGMPDLIENLDILASMRGAQDLLMDLYDRPAWVRRWVDRLADLYFEYFDRLREMIVDAEGGNAYIAFQVWGPGRTAKVQCDFAYMIGADMFADFVVPALTRQCDRLDHAVFHLDGPACIQHVKHLVRIESLDAIQWTPGAGNPTPGDPCWYDLYREVRAGGKSLLLLGGITEPEARAIAKEFGTEGILFYLAEPESEAAGEDLYKRVLDW